MPRIMKKWASAIFAPYAFAAILAGCGKTSERPENTVLHLYAGAGLRRGIDAVAAKFADKTGIKVEIDYGGSGMILNRATTNKDGDLFLPGDVWYVDELQRKTGMVESRTKIAKFVPVIIVAKGNPKGIRGLRDFFTPGVKTALGNPASCQIGRITKALFRKNGLDSSKLSAKLGLTVNELGVWVKMRDVDAAVVWDAIAANIANDVDIARIPEGKNIISEVSIALLKQTRAKNAARKFIDFIAKGEGRGILKSKGYNVDE